MRCVSRSDAFRIVTLEAASRSWARRSFDLETAFELTRRLRRDPAAHRHDIATDAIPGIGQPIRQLRVGREQQQAR